MKYINGLSSERILGFVYGFFSALIIISGSIAIVATNVEFILPQPISLEITTDAKYILCSGETFTVPVRATINRPSVLRTFTGIIDTKTRLPVLGHSEITDPFPRPMEETIITSFELTVPPNLPSGAYEYVLAVVPVSQSSLAEFLVVLFSVVNCD
jgi:hypothetical protein